MHTVLSKEAKLEKQKDEQNAVKSARLTHTKKNKTTSIFENFDSLREFLINQYCFILNDLNLLFANEKMREIMRANYLKEVLYFTCIYILIIRNRFEFAGLQKKIMNSKNESEIMSVKEYIISINKETEQLAVTGIVLE